MKRLVAQGNGGGCLGAVERLDLRARPLCKHVRADRAGQGRSSPWRHLCVAHSERRGHAPRNRSTRPIAIGKGASIPVHISHLKASEKAYWGTVGSALDRIVAARRAGQVVTADQYPYVASSTQLAAMVVPDWAIQGNADDFAGWPPTRNAGRCCGARSSEGSRSVTAGPRSGSRGSAPRPDWAGLDLVAIADREGNDGAGNRPGHPAERWRAGDQLRHVRGRRPRGNAP